MELITDQPTRGARCPKTPHDRHNFPEVVASRPPGDRNFREVVPIMCAYQKVISAYGLKANRPPFFLDRHD
jgi:hypothetical protein